MSLDPVELRELAQYMADETPVDMRVVGQGTFERVRIIGITLRLRRDDLELMQEWLDDEGEIECRTYVLDAEDVMWCRPSAFELADVMPRVGSPLDKPGLKPEDSYEWWMSRKAVAFTEGLTDDEMATHIAAPYRQDQGSTDIRHLVILVMYEITEEGDATICKRANYKSPMPMHSARSKARTDPAFERRFKKAVRRASLGGARLVRRHNSLTYLAARRSVV